MSIFIIVSEFHQEIASQMIKAAQTELESQGKKIEIHKVAGSYEIPLIADKILARPDAEAVLILGYIEKGRTKHGEVMGITVAGALVGIQLKYGKPMGMGIIGPGATKAQAKARALPQARKAAKAVLQSLSLLNEI